jgi:hypothetical protein
LVQQLAFLAAHDYHRRKLNNGVGRDVFAGVDTISTAFALGYIYGTTDHAGKISWFLTIFIAL